MAGFRLTTKVQVSGWRFLLRRVEHAIVVPVDNHRHAPPHAR